MGEGRERQGRHRGKTVRETYICTYIVILDEIERTDGRGRETERQGRQTRR